MLTFCWKWKPRSVLPSTLSTTSSWGVGLRFQYYERFYFFAQKNTFFVYFLCLNSKPRSWLSPILTLFWIKNICRRMMKIFIARRFHSFTPLFPIHMHDPKKHINHSDLSTFPFKFELKQRHEYNSNSTVSHLYPMWEVLIQISVLYSLFFVWFLQSHTISDYQRRYHHWKKQMICFIYCKDVLACD